VDVDGEQPLILDMGTGLRALGATLGARLELDGHPLRATVLLTHLHYDHVLGLPFFGPMRNPESVLDIYGPSQEASSLHGVLSKMVRPPFFPVNMADFSGDLRFHDLDGPVELTAGSIRVEARSVPHIGHTLGYRIEADGRVLAYIPDHQAPVGFQTVEDEVLRLCEGADLVIHDSQYTDQEFTTLSDWGHSTGNYAVRVAQESGARSLCMFHHDPAHSDDEIDQMLEWAQQLAAGSTGIAGNDRPAGHPAIDVTAASEGATVDLGAC
jgi:ribonuclease BN (tRNA processing enzyme)